MQSDLGADSAVSCDMVPSRFRWIYLPLLLSDKLDMVSDEMGEIMQIHDPLACEEAWDAEGWVSWKAVEEWRVGNADGWWDCCSGVLALVATKESPTLYLDNIVNYLAVIHEIHVPTTTLDDNHEALGLTYKRMQCIAFKSQRHQDARHLSGLVWRYCCEYLSQTVRYYSRKWVQSCRLCKYQCIAVLRLKRHVLSKSFCPSVLPPDSFHVSWWMSWALLGLIMNYNECFHCHCPHYHWIVPCSSPTKHFWSNFAIGLNISSSGSPRLLGASESIFEGGGMAGRL